MIKKIKNVFQSTLRLLVSSESGAVVRDIISTINRRNKYINIIIYPSQVQGLASLDNIIDAIKIANTRNEVDVLIIARGGGSIEDLWSFNDEKGVKTIAASSIPTISAIGHETDFTIADFVADLRAPTPTAAAEMDSNELSILFDKLNSFFFKSFSNVLYGRQFWMVWFFPSYNL